MSTPPTGRGGEGVSGTEKGVPRDGAIILLHDGHWSGAEGREQLEKLIQVLASKGTLTSLSPVPPRHRAINYDYTSP